METKHLARRDLTSWRERWFDPPFSLLQRTIDEEFERLSRKLGVGVTEEPGLGIVVAPALEVSESDNVVHVQAQVPGGLEAKDIDISLLDDLLTLKGERREFKGSDNRYRRYSAFKRTLALPGHVLADQARATLHDGVLKVDLPLASGDSRRVHKIPVQKD
ncbi:MAG TPA: Hsp20/alpha crystallin family protein [bacterium]